jgi:hypothetical protein
MIEKGRSTEEAVVKLSYKPKKDEGQYIGLRLFNK